MTSFDGTAFLVSGTSDSGQALARTIAANGGTVAFTYHEASDSAADLLEELPGSSHDHWQCDVTDRDDVASVTNEVFTDHDVDALVYTVGVIERAAVDELSIRSWHRHLEANVTGAFNVIAETAPRFAEVGAGSIVALSASPGILRNTDLSAYDASKQALEAFVLEAAREFGPDGVRANVVAPGFIRDPDALSDDARQDLLDQQPYKQLTSPRAIANACLFLCSEEAATITGAVLPVDSGLAL